MLSLLLLLAAQGPFGFGDLTYTAQIQVTGGRGFGRQVVSVGDIDHDGVDDFAACSYEASGFDVYVYSGASLGLRFRLPASFTDRTAPTPFHFVDGGEDLNQDGTPDILVRNYGGHAYSGVDGSPIRDYYLGSGTYSSSIAFVGDIDGDAVSDVFGGGEYEAYLVSGATGVLIHKFQAPNVSGYYFSDYGANVDGLGDIDGDAIPDLLVGGYSYGHLLVYSGATYAILHDVVTGHGTGSAAGIGDYDGDGYGDFATTAGGAIADQVIVMSGTSGAVIEHFRDYVMSGRDCYSILGLSDFDLDGHRDLAIGAIGRIYVISGRSAEIYLLPESPNNAPWYGFSICEIQGRGADSLPDLVVGAPASAYGTNLPGSVEVWDSFWNPILSSTALTVSASQGGSVSFAFDFPYAERYRTYSLLASLSTGATFLQDQWVPLGAGSLLTRSFLGRYPAYLSAGTGVLDTEGNGVSHLVAGPGDLAQVVGRTLWFACASYKGSRPGYYLGPGLTSAAVPLVVLP